MPIKTDQADFANSTKEEIKGKHGDTIDNSDTGEWDFDGATIKNANLEGGITDAYSNPEYPDLTTKTLALDYLLYTKPNILTFTNDVNVREKGTIVNNVILDWTINKSVDKQTINNGVGDIASNLRTKSLINQGLSVTITYQLTVTDTQGNTDIANTSIKFLNKLYRGTSPNGSLNNAQILALASNQYIEASSFPVTFTMNGNGEYLYFALPSSLGPVTFTVNGLVNTAWIETLQSFTNSSGFTEQYRIYRSTFLQNGTGISIQLTL